MVCGAVLHIGKCPNLCTVCNSHLLNGTCPNLCKECNSHLEEGVCPKCGKQQEKYKKVMLRIEGISIAKIADLNRGVLLPISREIGGFKITLEFDITNEDGISKEIIEKTVRDAVTEIGAKIAKEELK